jgi:hypothetical protein
VPVAPTLPTIPGTVCTPKPKCWLNIVFCILRCWIVFIYDYISFNS